ncbi:hypothetical protein ACU686_43135 [Yinghuangia aomiensis]
MLLEMFAKAQRDVTAALKGGAQIPALPERGRLPGLSRNRDAGPAEQEELRARLGLQVYPGNTLESALDWDPVDAPHRHPGRRGHRRARRKRRVVVRDGGELHRSWSSSCCRGWRAWPRRPRHRARPTRGSDYARRLATQAPAWRRAGRTYFAATSVKWG